MTKPTNDEVGIMLTMATMGLFSLIMLGYYVYSYWGAITALFH